MDTAGYDLELAHVGAFRGPPEVLIGDGAVDDIPQMIAGWGLGDGPVLLVCDRVVAQLGLSARVLDALAAEPNRAETFDQIDGEPDSATAAAVVQAARANDYVAVIGLGGGSAMDLAKLAAGLATNPGEVLDAVGVDRLADPALPLLLIPTTAGTGAEATRISMISHGGEKRIINDVQLIARGVVLDATLVTSLPKPVTAATGLDALSHAIEGALSANATALSTRSSFDAVELLARSLPRAYVDGGDLAARRGCLVGSYLAGLALNAGSILGHSMGYTIANRVKVPHGISVAMSLPYCIAYAATAATDRIDTLFARAGEPAADHAHIYGWIDALLHDLEVPTALSDLGLTRADANDMARECVERYPRPNNPTPLELDRLTDLYGFMWNGNLDAAVSAFTDG